MMSAAALGPHTVKDWLATPEGEHWELIRGNLVMTEETYGNSWLAGEIEWKIRNYLDTDPRGIVERKIAFVFPGLADAGREGVVPDLCYIPNEQLDKVEVEANVQEGVIPALVVEVVSPSTGKLDLVDKVEIYREAGIAEYWIFDRHQETVRIYRFAENALEPVAIKGFQDSVTTPLLPGFVLDMPRIQRALAVRRKNKEQKS